MPMPNFLVIGAAKAGTTSLWYYLKQHPQIYMSPVKEPNFFSFAGEQLDFRGPGDPLDSYSVTDLEAYRALFQGVSGERAIGEVSPTYLYIPRAPQRIRHYLPDAKLIAILRNPIERAYSSFLYLVREDRESLTDFAQALREEERRIRNNWGNIWHYKQGGFYYAQLKRYYELFAREQIKVYLYEDLDTDPIGTMHDFFRFLGVDDRFVPDLVRYNVSGVPRSTVLKAIFVILRPIGYSFEPFLPDKLRRPLLHLFVSLKNWNLVKPPLRPEVRRQLIQEYREDIIRLQDLLQRDLSEWLKEER